jgi:nitroimidazol reductase NimA-like FMN-containing flavoprotein (pyridoxamine 5'-phosphate oxidase superfamily)
MVGMSVDKSGLEVLDEDACFALLGTVPIGRVVYSDRALPVIVPVNYTLVGADVVIRTGRRSRLATHASGNVVAFEVDEIDPATRSGWSVVLTGRFQLVDRQSEIDRLEALGLVSWAPSAHDSYLRLRPDIISGRRIPVADTAPEAAQAEVAEAAETEQAEEAEEADVSPRAVPAS